MGRRGTFSILIRLARRGDISPCGLCAASTLPDRKTAASTESSVYILQRYNANCDENCGGRTRRLCEKGPTRLSVVRATMKRTASAAVLFFGVSAKLAINGRQSEHRISDALIAGKN